MKLHGGDLGKLKPPPTSSALCCQPSWVDTNCSLGPGLDSPLRFWPIARRSKTCGEQWWASFSQPRFTFPRMHCHTCPRCQSHSGDGLAQRHPPCKDMLLWCLHTYTCVEKKYINHYPVFIQSSGGTPQLKGSRFIYQTLLALSHYIISVRLILSYFEKESVYCFLKYRFLNILYFLSLFVKCQSCAAFNFILWSKKVIIGLIYKPRSNLPCHFLPAVSCWFYLPVALVVLPVENGAILQRVHSWLEDKTSRL